LAKEVRELLLEYGLETKLIPCHWPMRRC